MIDASICNSFMLNAFTPTNDTTPHHRNGACSSRSQLHETIQRDLDVLRITVHDDFRPVTLLVEGRVAEPSLDVLEDCWRSAVAKRRGVRIDLKAVTFIDAAGKECLAKMYRHGAELIARGCAMTHIVTEIMRYSPRD